MLHLRLFKEHVVDNEGMYPVYSIDLIDKINYIIGLSGTGKSYFIKAAMEAASTDYGMWHIKCELPVVVISNSTTKTNDIMTIINNNINSLIICDEAIVVMIRKSNLLGKLAKSQNYFLMCDRTSMIKDDVNVNAVFEFKKRNFNGHKVFDTIKTLQLKRSNDNSFDIDFVVTEDAESGLLFWQSAFSKVKVHKFKRHSNGEVVKQIKYLLNKYNGNILVILDYDRGAIMMRKIMINKRIDKSRIYFMPLESFEEVICNSEFILSKFPELREYVINYQDHINCKYKSTGKYFSALLFNIVRVKSPIKTIGEKNYTKFYEKGMKNFKECFIDDCCAYGASECKLYCSEDKKRTMLANKFEMYRRFI